MRVLFYAPDPTGHPQVYCNVLAGIFLEAGHEVVVAGARFDAPLSRNWPLLAGLERNPKFQFVAVEDHGGRAGKCPLEARALRQLQQDLGVESTLFIEGDYFADEFRKIAVGEAPPLHGCNSAIFAATSWWHPGEDPYTGQPASADFLSLRGARKFLHDLRNRKASQRYFYEEVLIRNRLVDALIVKDERILEKHGAPVVWMPEIFQTFDGGLPEPADEAELEQCAAIRELAQKVGADRLLLFFGTGAWYKGYDYFLKLAVEDAEGFAVHVGAPVRHENGKAWDFDPETSRNELLARNRIYETGGFARSVELVGTAFRTVDKFVSTHRLTQSSGTMLQALQEGKPVLVPETGLVGWRARNFGLGMTYRYLDMPDLVAQWRVFRERPSEEFRGAIDAYMQQFTREAIARTFLGIMCA